MGALPSRESNEGPNTIYFGNNTGVVTFRLPLTPHFFPRADCLAFKEVHRVRNSQSCKYSFNIKEAFAVLPEAAALDFQAAQEEDWGPEADAVDPSLHYQDDEVVARLAEHGAGSGVTARDPDAKKARHLRPSIESRQGLYQKLVIDPTANALVDTDDEMRELFFAEKRWRAARDVVRRHRAFLRQQNMSEAERAVLDDAARVAEDVDGTALEEAESVPPPAKWLRPIPEVVVERMSMEEACVAHRRHRERRLALLANIEPPEEKPSAPISGTPADRRDMRCNLGRVMPRQLSCDAVSLSVLDTHGRQPLVETETLNEEVLKSYPNFQDDLLPFELDEQYMDGRVHLVPYEGVNYIFAYNPEYVRKMGKTVAVDGSLAEERRRGCGAVQSERARPPFTTTHLVATRKPEDFDDPNQRRAYEIFQPVYERYYVPVMPVRVLGVDGLIPCSSSSSSSAASTHTAAEAAENGDGGSDIRGAPWMRGVEHDEEEEAYEERTLRQRYGVAPPPVLRACRFIHAVIGDKILNRMSVLGCMTFRERCLNAGLPDAIACPLWAVMELNDIPQLQFQREIELRLLAAMHEIEDGDMRIRNALARQHRWNDYVSFTNSPMYGFMVSAPPERRFRVGADGKLKEVGAGEDDAESSGNSSGNEKEQDEESGSSSHPPRHTKKGGKGITGAAAEMALSDSANRRAYPDLFGKEGAKLPANGGVASSSNLSSSNGTRPGLELQLPGPTSSPSSDTESRDEHSGSTSARSAAHNSSITIIELGSTAKVGTAATTPGAAATAAARVKRTRDGHTCIGGCAPPETAEQSAALETAMTNAGISQSCAAAVTEEDDLTCIAEPPAELRCAWSFKRRRLGLTEEVWVDPNFSEEDWMPMVNPLTRDAALATMGVRVSVRGRLALVRYSAGAMQKVAYYLSQASAPIFCLPYVGPPQQCPNIYFESVVRVPAVPKKVTTTTTPVPQNGLQPPTAEQVRTALAAYAQGRVSCHVFVNLDDRAPNPPTSIAANHFKDDALLDEPMSAGITSKLILAQVPIKADARCALEWYRKSLQYGAACMLEGASPYAAWPALLDAPAPADGDVLVVCPRTHRWMRVTTLVLLTTLLAVHRKNRLKEDEMMEPIPVLDLFCDDQFAVEVGICYDAMTHKNTDSEGMQCYALNMRNYFSYNGIIELVLDKLRTIADQEKYEDKDDKGWLVLHDPPTGTPSGPGAASNASSSVVSTPTTASNTVTTMSTSRTLDNSAITGASTAAGALTSQKYMESGSFFIWSFEMAGQRYFLGTKPRFIRLALQRQKQNQRRRQKRKGRDGPTTATTATTTADGGVVNGAVGGKAAANEKSVPKRGAGSATYPTSTATPTSTGLDRGASAAPSVQMAHSISSSSTSSVGAAAAATSHFTPQTSFSAVPPPAFTGLPITETDKMQLVHDALASQSRIHAQPHDQQQNIHPHHHHHREAALTAHIPYAPLLLSSDDRVVNDECNEMRELRHLHTRWIESRGLLITSPDGAPTSDHAKWELPPLAGQPNCRRRLVVPIAPHGMGRPRIMDCSELGCDVAAGGMDGGRPMIDGYVNEEDRVPVQRPATPREVDAQRGNFRWNPYRVGE